MKSVKSGALLSSLFGCVRSCEGCHLASDFRHQVRHGLLATALLLGLSPWVAHAQLQQVYENSGSIELQAIGADVIVHSGGAGWHDSSSTDANDGETFVYYDIDNSLGLGGAGATFDSSSVDYALASGKSIIKAILVWGAKVDDSFNDVSGVQRDVRLYVRDATDVPNGSYVDITADGGSYGGPIGGGPTAFDLYGYHADVTQYFSGLAAGSTYKVVVANIEARLDSGMLGGAAAGWALHLVLDNPSLTDEYYIAIYGGLQIVNPNNTVDTPITGLNVPASTLGQTYIASSALDGDVNRADTYSFGADAGSLVALSDALHPATDFHNARRTYEAAFYDTNPGPIAGSSPNYDKVTHDLVQLAPNAAFNLPGGTTDAQVRLTTSGSEGINLTSFALATPNNAPRLTLTKETTMVNGGPVTAVLPGDILTYQLTLENDGTARANAVEVVMEDALPASVQYVAGSTLAEGPALTITTETYRDNFTAVAYNNSNGSATWTSAWDETGDNDLPGSGTIAISGGVLRFLNLDGDSIARAVDLGSATSATLTLDWVQVVGNESLRVELWNGTDWDLAGSTGSGAGSITHTLTEAQISASSQIRLLTNSGNWGDTEQVNIDNVQFEFSTATGPTVVTKDNNPSGSNDLVDGDPAGQLVAPADNFFLAPGDSLTVTFEVEVEDVACAEITNTASASAADVVVPAASATTNLCAKDYGDGPASYGDASHRITPSLHMGSLVPDHETQSLNAANGFADGVGDDNTGADDEDGVVFRSPSGGDHAELYADVSVVNDTGDDAYVCAWLDVWDASGNADGSFGDASDGPLCQTVADNGGFATMLTFYWGGLEQTQGSTFARFRVCDTLTQCNSPAGLAASESRGEVEDYLVPFDFRPTAATIGRVELQMASLDEVVSQLQLEGQSAADLMELLASWSPEMAADLQGAAVAEVQSALMHYLDPDGDGNVAVLRWETLQERGTIGFYVERRQEAGGWLRLNGGMLPGLIDAPLGGEYWLADPEARSGIDYLYRLIEQEAWGTHKVYGPWLLRP